MFIADAIGRLVSTRATRPRRIAAALFTYCMLGAPCAHAHPLSQGALDVIVFPDRVAVRATVSPEEVLVAAAADRTATTSRPDMLRRHADYLLAHLHVLADEHELNGHLVGAPTQDMKRPVYEFEYPLPGTSPARVVLREDVLREIDYAPGNPWEASYLVRIGNAGHAAIEGLLLTFAQPVEFSPGDPNVANSSLHIATSFVTQGILHILTGYDHLLFVGALLMAVVSLWDLIKVISAFTLAHTCTLVLATLDIVRLPSTVVEPMIAASIVFVAVENILSPRRSHGRSRLVVAFGFGLFHGLGFAGGLIDSMAGMPTVSAALAIAAFSLGVELGHQIVVLPVFGALTVLRRGGADTRRHRLVQRAGSAVISLAGTFYLVSALR